MMRWLTVAATFLSAFTAQAQITITAADMPIHHDTLRFSNADAMSITGWAADSGADMNWNYTLVATSQGLDEYKRPVEVSPALTGGFFGGITADYCYGTKVADSIPGLSLLASGLTISNLHTYYNKYITPPCFVAEAFSATMSILPVGTDYILPDVLYQFPLTYGNQFNHDFHLIIGAATFGSIEQKGNRSTRVDGWGKITTPFYTSPTPCIRVRSEIVEIDSVELSGNKFGIERTTVEYKWLVNGSHQPALMLSAILVGGNEIVTTARFQDHYRPEFSTSVKNTSSAAAQVSAYPNPVTSGQVHFSIPASWKSYFIELFDVQGKMVATAANTNELNMAHLAKGTYLARITTDGATAYVKLER